jgi:hypothetical protein
MTITGELPPLRDVQAARRFLDESGRGTRQRGEDYFRSGAVLELWCSTPGIKYAARVRGQVVYEVALFFEKKDWFSDCTCPMIADCKHGVAAMLALLERTGGLENEADPSGRKAGAVTLERRLEEALKRPLKDPERQFARKVRQWFIHYESQGQLPNWDLRPLAPSLKPHEWLQLELGDKFPSDTLEFWQCLAFTLTQRGATLPPFMMALADNERMGKEVAARRRRQEIEQWQKRLQVPLAVPASPSFGGPVDLRIVIKSAVAVLQWKPPGQEQFRPLKSSQLRQLESSGQLEEMTVVPEAQPFWQAMAVRWRYGRSFDLRLYDVDVQRLVRSWVRLPALRERIVNAQGTPFEYGVEPLRWELRPPATASEDYQLRLVARDGRPAPKLLAVLPGAPTLYISETTVFEGPMPCDETGDRTTALDIPAPALESRDGIHWLLQLDVDLPPRLQEQTRRVAMRVHIRAEMKSLYGGSETVFVWVNAEAENKLCRENYTVAGWQEDYSSTTPSRKQDEDIVFLFDRKPLLQVPALLAPLRLKWDVYGQCWSVRVTKKFPDMFATWMASLPPEMEVLVRGELATLRQQPVRASIRLDCTAAGVDWFDLKVALDVPDMKLTDDEVKALLDARGGWVRLGKKGWRRLQFDLAPEDDEQLARLGLNPRDFTSEPQRLHALQLADPAAARFLPEAQVREIRRRAEQLQTRVTPPVPEAVRATLRPYQIEGFHFLAYLGANRFGGILADDMGLGKTLQTLTWLAWVRTQDDKAGRPSLVVCPKSVMDNWRMEAERFVPGLRVRIWHGTNAKKLAEAVSGVDLLVVNYTQLRALARTLAGVNWLAAILDEGQYIKNPEAQTARAARGLKADQRLILTGTPIENRLLDLWSLVSFAMPGVLGSRAQFAQRFDQAGDPLARRRLAARVRPFLLRRTKAQVAKDLPDRVEEDLVCEMEGAQQVLYRATFKHAQQMLLKVKTATEFDQQRFNFLTALLRLRQICCHPALVDAQKTGAESAKVNALLDLLEPLVEEGHKVLVFSQFVAMLDLLQPLLQERGWPQFMLTGATENRGSLIANFQSTPGAAVFLISLKAGGFGLNLTAASYVVLFDPWWNPAVENQAIDRTHRIGQVNKVIAYRLLIKDSIEEKIRALQRQKRTLAEDILGEERFAQGMTLEDLRFLFAE